jgi:hypothetical protein
VAFGIQSQLVALALLGATSAQAGTLASYSFDDDRLDTGPDTYRVYEYGKGSVTLTSRYHWSGYQAVEIREKPGDHDFAELQGYFEKQESGRLYFHFAFMVATPKEELNIGLSGPICFKLVQHGLAFWLSTENGWLYHHSDSIPKKLFELDAFTWYGVDVRYDIPTGTYDLSIEQEGKAVPLVRVSHQPNVINSPGSAIDKFSFIGDIPDEGSVVYYVDDVVIGVDGETPEIKFAAPGRKKLFVDRWKDAKKAEAGKLACPASYELADFGIDRSEQADLKRLGAIATLHSVLVNPLFAGFTTTGNAKADAAIGAAYEWALGCRALAKQDFEGALKSFDKAAGLKTGVRIAELSRVLALAGLKRWDEIDSSLIKIERNWRDDPRYALVLAQAALNRKELPQAARAIEGPALEELKSPQLNRRQVLSEQYFDLLLWTDRCRDAQAFASSISSRLKPAPRTALASYGLWLLYEGDAELLCGNAQVALKLYQKAVESAAPPGMGYERLSDAYHLLKDPARERENREKLYGSLREDKSKK